jgi:hypothetical protein
LAASVKKARAPLNMGLAEVAVAATGAAAAGMAAALAAGSVAEADALAGLGRMSGMAGSLELFR